MKIESYKNWRDNKFEDFAPSAKPKKTKKRQPKKIDANESEEESVPSQPEIFLKPIYDQIKPHLPISVGDGYLKSLSKKEAIKRLQAVLNVGLDSGLKVDGNYGPVTHSALSNWNPRTDSNEVDSDCIIVILNKARESGIDPDHMLNLIWSASK
jgi:hypothetical protein